MEPMTLAALIGAGVGTLKAKEKQSQADAKRKLAATVATYSPWTGMTPDFDFRDPSFMGEIAQGALTGALLGQNWGAGAAKAGL